MMVYHLRRKRFKSATLKYSDIRIVKRAARSSRQRYRFVLTVLRVLAVALFVVAFARPRAGTEYTDVTSEGIDIMLCLDVSSSMQAEDFKPNNRLYVAKEEIKKFIEQADQRPYRTGGVRPLFVHAVSADARLRRAA